MTGLPPACGDRFPSTRPVRGTGKEQLSSQSAHQAAFYMTAAGYSHGWRGNAAPVTGKGKPMNGTSLNEMMNFVRAGESGGTCVEVAKLELYGIRGSKDPDRVVVVEAAEWKRSEERRVGKECRSRRS